MTPEDKLRRSLANAKNSNDSARRRLDDQERASNGQWGSGSGESAHHVERSEHHADKAREHAEKAIELGKQDADRAEAGGRKSESRALRHPEEAAKHEKEIAHHAEKAASHAAKAGDHAEHAGLSAKGSSDQARAHVAAQKAADLKKIVGVAAEYADAAKRAGRRDADEQPRDAHGQFAAGAGAAADAKAKDAVKAFHVAVAAPGGEYPDKERNEMVKALSERPMSDEARVSEHQAIRDEENAASKAWTQQGFTGENPDKILAAHRAEAGIPRAYVLASHPAVGRDNAARAGSEEQARKDFDHHKAHGLGGRLQQTGLMVRRGETFEQHMARAEAAKTGGDAKAKAPRGERAVARSETAAAMTRTALMASGVTAGGAHYMDAHHFEQAANEHKAAAKLNKGEVKAFHKEAETALRAQVPGLKASSQTVSDAERVHVLAQSQEPSHRFSWETPEAAQTRHASDAFRSTQTQVSAAHEKQVMAEAAHRGVLDQARAAASKYSRSPHDKTPEIREGERVEQAKSLSREATAADVASNQLRASSGKHSDIAASHRAAGDIHSIAADAHEELGNHRQAEVHRQAMAFHQHLATIYGRTKGDAMDTEDTAEARELARTIELAKTAKLRNAIEMERRTDDGDDAGGGDVGGADTDADGDAGTDNDSDEESGEHTPVRSVFFRGNRAGGNVPVKKKKKKKLPGEIVGDAADDDEEDEPDDDPDDAYAALVQRLKDLIEDEESRGEDDPDDDHDYEDREDADFKEEDHPREKGKFSAAGAAADKAESAAHRAGNARTVGKASAAADTAMDHARDASRAAKVSGTSEDYDHSARAHAAASAAHSAAVGANGGTEPEDEEYHAKSQERHADYAGKKADRSSDAAKTADDHAHAASAHEHAQTAHAEAAADTEDESREAHHEGKASEHGDKAAGEHEKASEAYHAAGNREKAVEHGEKAIAHHEEKQKAEKEAGSAKELLKATAGLVGGEAAEKLAANLPGGEGGGGKKHGGGGKHEGGDESEDSLDSPKRRADAEWGMHLIRGDAEDQARDEKGQFAGGAGGASARESAKNALSHANTLKALAKQTGKPEHAAAAAQAEKNTKQARGRARLAERSKDAATSNEHAAAATVLEHANRQLASTHGAPGKGLGAAAPKPVAAAAAKTSEKQTSLREASAKAAAASEAAKGTTYNHGEISRHGEAATAHTQAAAAARAAGDHGAEALHNSLAQGHRETARASKDLHALSGAARDAADKAVTAARKSGTAESSMVAKAMLERSGSLQDQTHGKGAGDFQRGQAAIHGQNAETRAKGLPDRERHIGDDQQKAHQEYMAKAEKPEHEKVFRSSVDDYEHSGDTENHADHYREHGARNIKTHDGPDEDGQESGHITYQLPKGLSHGQFEKVMEASNRAGDLRLGSGGNQREAAAAHREAQQSSQNAKRAAQAGRGQEAEQHADKSMRASALRDNIVHSPAAHAAGREAKDLSVRANQTNEPEAHDTAAQAHDRAYSGYRNAGEPGLANEHSTLASGHRQAARTIRTAISNNPAGRTRVRGS